MLGARTVEYFNKQTMTGLIDPHSMQTISMQIRLRVIKLIHHPQGVDNFLNILI